MSWTDILKNQNEIMKDIIEEEKEVRACLIVLDMIKENAVDVLLESEYDRAELEELSIFKKSSKGEVEKMHRSYTQQLNAIKDIKLEMKLFYRLSNELNKQLRFDLLDLIQTDKIVGEIEGMGL